MELRSVEGNTQRLDGGAMFGNAPRALWARWCPPDEHNRIGLACRSLLIYESAGRLVMLETGIGAFFEPRLRERFGVQEHDHVLLRSLATMGVTPSQIDIIVLSHLHFDHAGGLLEPWRPDTDPVLAFPNAAYVVSDKAWERARNPHPRDRVSFIPELPALLEATGRLEIVQAGTDGQFGQSKLLGESYQFSRSDGHTPGLLLTTVATARGPLTFMGDLVPGVPWVNLPITMGYDRYPELLIDEKKALLARIEAEDGWMFFTHDTTTAAAKIGRDERGRFAATDCQALVDWAD